MEIWNQKKILSISYISLPAGHKLGKLGNKMGSSLKLGSAGRSFYKENVKYVTIISQIQNILNICHKSPNILEYVCYMF